MKQNKLPSRKIQIFKEGKLYLFDFPLHYSTQICEDIGQLAIDKFLNGESTLITCKKNAIKEIFEKHYAKEK